MGMARGRDVFVLDFVLFFLVFLALARFFFFMWTRISRGVLAVLNLETVRSSLLATARISRKNLFLY